MPPPPATPSPRRFIVKKPRPQATPLAQEIPHASSQFNATPRFTFSSTPRPVSTQPEPSRATPFAAARYLTPNHKTVNRQDAIEDSSDSVLQETTEVEEHDVDLLYGYGGEESDFSIEEPTSKRRKVTSSPDPDLLGGAAEEQDDELKPSIEEAEDDQPSSSLPILSSPPAPKRHPTTAPRFLVSTPAPAASSQPPSTQTTFLKPPRFRPPDPSEQAQHHSDPLPEHFSPHRKGQKYVPGGLAAEVRDWLVNIESTVSTRAVASDSKEDVWLIKILVEEVSGDGRVGMTLISGRQVHDGGIANSSGTVQVVLAGEGTGTGLQKGSPVVAGKMVGIKGPLWDIMIDEVRWGVGVNWKVLN